MRMVRRLAAARAGAALAVGFAVLGCSSTGSIPRPAPSPKPYFQTTNEAGDYIIQHGDLMTVAFFNNPELNEDARVRPDGKITLQLIGDVEAAGLSPTELDQRLTQAFSSELIQPDLTVIVREFARQVFFVGGEVNGPGVKDLSVGMTALNGIMSAGGFTANARMTEVVIIRRGPDARPYGWKVDMKNVLYDADMSRDVVLQPYDVIFVPKEKIVQFNEFIQKYILGILPFRPYFRLNLDDITGRNDDNNPNNDDGPEIE
ncbi:MAG: polysaccharide biosynthesis/export family protein [Gemmatimonadota bacterium]